MEHLLLSLQSAVGVPSKMLLMSALMVVLFFPVLYIAKKFVDTIFSQTLKVTPAKYAEIIEKHKIHKYFIHIVISSYLITWGSLYEEANYLSNFVVHIKNKVLTVYATVFISAIFGALIDIFTDIYKKRSTSYRLPIDLHTNILKIVIWVCASLIVVSTILNLNLPALFTSIGAAAALLTFVFKDTLQGLFASLQLTFQDVIRVGDWINVPSYNANGNVETINISFVKIRNFDNTVIFIPTHALTSISIQNWRAMHDTGARRIKRAVNIDMESIIFLNQADISEMKENPLLKDLVEGALEEATSTETVTNLTIFRFYLESYLKAHKSIHNENYLMLIRELEPTSSGLPLEVYAFSKETSLDLYEKIQAEIFDHLIAIMPEFKLKVFQAGF